jgi:hypothetical protein
MKRGEIMSDRQKKKISEAQKKSHESAERRPRRTAKQIEIDKLTERLAEIEEQNKRLEYRLRAQEKAIAQENESEIEQAKRLDREEEEQQHPHIARLRAKGIRFVGQGPREQAVRARLRHEQHNGASGV